MSVRKAKLGLTSTLAAVHSVKTSPNWMAEEYLKVFGNLLVTSSKIWLFGWIQLLIPKFSKMVF